MHRHAQLSAGDPQHDLKLACEFQRTFVLGSIVLVGDPAWAMDAVMAALGSQYYLPCCICDRP